MQPLNSEPYITASLSGEQTTLDLSGKQPFTLSITLTLHASAPILAYTDPNDTFFLPRNALTHWGIIFTSRSTKQEVKTCHIDCCRSPGYARLLTEKSTLLLRPERPMVFDVPFDILCEKEEEGDEFDPWFATITSGFEDGGVYEATLPLYRTLDWWRYARPSEICSSNLFTISGLQAIADTAINWWSPTTEAKYGVPVLPSENHLPIYIEGSGVEFTCTGKKMEWPIDLGEKQRLNKERRDAEQHKITAEKRAQRERKY